MLLNVKMPTIVGILTIMSRINFHLRMYYRHQFYMFCLYFHWAGEISNYRHQFYIICLFRCPQEVRWSRMSKPYGRESDKMTFTPDLPTQDELNITLFELVEINFEDLPASSRLNRRSLF